VALIDADYLKGLPLGLKNRTLPEAEMLDALIETASDAIEDYCDRKFATQSHVERHAVRADTNRLILREYPLQSVTSIAWRDEAGNTGTVTVADLSIDPDGIIEFTNVLDGPFAAGTTYTVTYVAGYDTIPGAVKHAVALQVTELLQPNYSGPQREAAEIVPLSSELIVELLDKKYRRKVIGAA
jgi:uncharacterized phiE125 gp8 family phage protein